MEVVRDEKGNYKVLCTSSQAIKSELLELERDPANAGAMEMHHACIEAIKTGKYEFKATWRDIDLHAGDDAEHILIAIDEYEFEYKGETRRHQLLTCTCIYDKEHPQQQRGHYLF